MIHTVTIAEFMTLARQHPVLDVRSPGEYSHAHIPGAYSLPLFTDDERKVVGTAYKQQSRQQAIKLGLDYFGGNMRKMVEDTEALISAGSTPSANTVLVHCWRGGMRSAGVAWLLDLYGFRVYTLKGGYKAFRTWVLQQFALNYGFRILGGYTGSGKTPLLKTLAANGYTAIDLEGIAKHKGSAFGALGEEKQVSQEMFENELAVSLATLPAEDTIWVEDESRRIGAVNIPNALWETIRRSPVVFVDIPFEERLTNITATYGTHKKEELVNSIMRIQKRLGNLNTKNAIGYLLENNHRECFRILLAYYDKYYAKDLEDRGLPESMLTTVPCDNTDPATNFKQITSLKITT